MRQEVNSTCEEEEALMRANNVPEVLEISGGERWGRERRAIEASGLLVRELRLKWKGGVCSEKEGEVNKQRSVMPRANHSN